MLSRPIFTWGNVWALDPIFPTLEVILLFFWMSCYAQKRWNLIWVKKKKTLKNYCSHWALPYTWYTDIVLFVKCLNAKLWNRFLFEISLFNLFTHFVDDFLRIRKVKQIKSLPACCIHRNTWFQYNMDSCWVNLLRAWIIATCGALPWELIHF